jgi:hypothetical protein
MTYGEQFEIEEINAKKDRWRLTLLEGRLRLEREDESEVHEIPVRPWPRPQKDVGFEAGPGGAHTQGQGLPARARDL